MFELGGGDAIDFICGYRIYITGDTLIVDELKEIPELYANERLDLMVAHRGGTTRLSPALAPLALMGTCETRSADDPVDTAGSDNPYPL